MEGPHDFQRPFERIRRKQLREASFHHERTLLPVVLGGRADVDLVRRDLAIANPNRQVRVVVQACCHDGQFIGRPLFDNWKLGNLLRILGDSYGMLPQEDIEVPLFAHDHQISTSPIPDRVRLCHGLRPFPTACSARVPGRLHLL